MPGMIRPVKLLVLLAFILSGCESLPQAEEPITEPEMTPSVIEPQAQLECPEPSPEPEVIYKTADCPIDKDIATIGEVEWVTIMPESIRQKARIDTGATTTSIGVIKHEKYERDGKTWVKFMVRHRETGEEVELRRQLSRVVNIKRHGAEETLRPVVKVELALGGIKALVEVSLADREKFDYPVLIGRNFLEGRAVVNVSEKFAALEEK